MHMNRRFLANHWVKKVWDLINYTPECVDKTTKDEISETRAAVRGGKREKRWGNETLEGARETKDVVRETRAAVRPKAGDKRGKRWGKRDSRGGRRDKRRGKRWGRGDKRWGKRKRNEWRKTRDDETRKKLNVKRSPFSTSFNLHIWGKAKEKFDIWYEVNFFGNCNAVSMTLISSTACTEWSLFASGCTECIIAM